MAKKKNKASKSGIFGLSSSSKNTKRVMKAWFSVLVYLAAIAIMGILFTRLPLTGFAGLPDETPPVIYDPVPENNSYVSGGDKSFFIRIDEENLNESTVRLYIKAEDSENWDNYLMTCAIMGDDWVCEVYGVTLSLNIVGSDTAEEFYFIASDNSSNTGYLGTPEQPLIFTVDVNPPDISFSSPENETYIAGNTTIELEIVDMSSGVDSNSVAYSFDNETWTTMSGSESTYTGEFNSTQFSDNESVILYAKASDNINNEAYKWINVSVDNTDPTIDIIEPSENVTLSGVSYFEINATDIHSGIDASSAYLSVGSSQRSMDCTRQDGKYVCTEYFDTNLVSDGQISVIFGLSDYAGNVKTSTIPVTIDNEMISVSITSPPSGSYINDQVYINATVSNAEGRVSGVQIGISGSGYETEEAMTCSSEYDCYFVWSVSGLTEGEYTLTVNATAVAETIVGSSISLIVDKTGPNLQIDSPGTREVNGTISPKVIITDVYGVDSTTVRFNISTYSEATNCVRYIQGKKYVCTGNFNTSLLSDSDYTLVFYGNDLAGNSNQTSKILTVYNGGITSDSDQTSPTTTVPGTTTTTAPSGSTSSNLIDSIISPIVIALENIGVSLKDIFEEWPAQALAISMIIVIIVIAIFRNSQIIRFFKKSKTEKPKVEGEEA